MFAPGQNQLLANLSLLLFFKDLSIVRFYDLKRTFEECVSLFSYQRSFCFAVCLKQLCYYIMSFPACQELFSTFLKLFLFLSRSNFDILSHPTSCCQELFSFLFDSFVISARSLRRNFDRIPPLPGFVNRFLLFFL